jgi:hypothetical protein
MKNRFRAGFVAAIAAAALIAVAFPMSATEVIDYDSLNKIKQQGMGSTNKGTDQAPNIVPNSQVMEVMSYLTDVHGPRLTGSPNIKAAGDWAVAKMKEWGLTNAALEPWTPCPAPAATPAPATGAAAGAPAGGGRGGPAGCRFPRGWANEKFYLQAVAPQQFPIPGTPSGWSPGTNGLVRGEVVLITETVQEELVAKYAGKLNGKWVITSLPPDVAAYWSPLATRRTIDELAAMENPRFPAELGSTPPGGRGGNAGGGGGGRGGAGGGGGFNRTAWLKDQGVVGTLSTQARGHGIYTISGSATTDPNTALTAVTIPAEQYGRIARMLVKNIPVTIEADIKNTYYPNPPMFNVVGEIRGTDKADEVVMLGAHFDSWHASTGATDNAAGSAAMMEAMRILKQSGVRLRRTVRIGLWTGEEQGLIGSADYVSRHFGPAPGAGGGRAGGTGAGGAQPATRTPAQQAEWDKFSAYFNIDNGTGAIRGIYLQGNQAVAPIFRDWIEPFRTLGMTTITIDNTGGTDHQSFDRVNLPGFQFIQDDIEYDTMTHHTNLDSYERIQPEDMRRMSVIAASFAFLAANREEKLPRKPPTSQFPSTGGRGRGGQ